MLHLPANAGIRFLFVVGYLRLTKRAGADTGQGIPAFSPVYGHYPFVRFSYGFVGAGGSAGRVIAMVAPKRKRKKPFRRFMGKLGAPSHRAGINLIPVLACHRAGVAGTASGLVKIKR
jgi:hypothetical protein